MRTGELAAPFPTVGLDDPAVEAAQLLAGQNLPGLIVVMKSADPGRCFRARRYCAWRCRPTFKTIRPWPG